MTIIPLRKRRRNKTPESPKHVFNSPPGAGWGNCPACHGSGGGDEPALRCPFCKGSGKVWVEEEEDEWRE